MNVISVGAKSLSITLTSRQPENNVYSVIGPMSAIETLMSCFCCGYYLKLYRSRNHQGTQTGDICENNTDVTTAPLVMSPAANPNMLDREPFHKVTKEELKGMRKK
ncbi:uncharacterized protein LOC111134601 [Crassostrea virginica]